MSSAFESNPLVDQMLAAIYQGPKYSSSAYFHPEIAERVHDIVHAPGREIVAFDADELNSRGPYHVDELAWEVATRGPILPKRFVFSEHDYSDVERPVPVGNTDIEVAVSVVGGYVGICGWDGCTGPPG